MTPATFARARGIDCPECGHGDPDSMAREGCACCASALPHHPTSAELAAFRRSLPGWRQTTLGPRDFGEVPDNGAIGAAWDYEREQGLGYTGITVMGTPVDDEWHSRARIDASDLRSRAYQRAYGRHAAEADDWRAHIATDDAIAAHRAFVPFRGGSR